MEVVKVLYEGIQLVVVPFFPSFSHGGKSSAISTDHEKNMFSTEVTHKKQKTLHICYKDSKYIVCSNQRLSKQETATKLHNVLPWHDAQTLEAVYLPAYICVFDR